VWILAKICQSGYPGRSALAADIGVTARQVTRYLDALEARGLLMREGNGYGITNGGQRLISKAGLTFSDLPDRPEDLRVDTA
jgi:DNA-binding MarR family transcriptional regulator